MNWTVSLRAVKVVCLQPAMLFLFAIQACAVAGLGFGLTLEYDHGVLVGVTMFGKEIVSGEFTIMLDAMVRGIGGLVVQAVVFLSLLGLSSPIAEMLRDPLLPIELSKNVSRTRLLISKFVGLNGAVGLNFFVFTSLIQGVLFVKAGSNVGGHLLLYAFVLWLQLFFLASVGALLAMLLEHPTSVLVINVALFYFLFPLLLQAKDSSGALERAAGMCIPSFGNFRLMGSMTAFAMGPAEILLVAVQVSIYAAMYVAAAAYVFSKRDIV